MLEVSDAEGGAGALALEVLLFLVLRLEELDASNAEGGIIAIAMEDSQGRCDVVELKTNVDCKFTSGSWL